MTIERSPQTFFFCLLKIIIIAIIISGFIRKPELDDDGDETENFHEELKSFEKENLQITNKILGNLYFVSLFSNENKHNKLCHNFSNKKNI